MRRVSMLLLAIACQSDHQLVVPDVSLVIDSPTYGSFRGDDPTVWVTGQVSPPLATVTVNDVQVAVATNGRFEAELPIDGPYELIDVEASVLGNSAREYLPVFAGHDPMETWPGALTARLTEQGLDVLGKRLGEQIDAMGWDAQLLAALPSIDQGWFKLAPVAVNHSPTQVVMRPDYGGIETGIALNDVEIELELSVSLGNTPFSVPVTVGYGLVELGLLAVPHVDEAGMLSLQLTDAFIDMGEPDVTVAGIDLWLVELLLEGVAWIVEPAGEWLLTAVVDQIGELPLGGPYAFEADLMGQPLAIQLSEAYGDPWGLGLGLGVGLGEPIAPGPLDVPAPLGPASGEPPVHLVVGLHEGLVQGMISGELLGMLEQDLKLAGAFGELIGAGVRKLPGGHTAPATDGWCLKLDPGTAYASRLQSGLEPLAAIYLPDARVTVSTMQSGACVPWLTGSLAMELGLEVKSGTKLAVKLQIPEGAVFDYAAEGEWDEDEVVDGLGGMVEGLVGVLGSQLQFDLADLFGGLDPSGTGLLGELSPAIVSSEPMAPIDGEAWEGMYAVGLQLWEE